MNQSLALLYKDPSLAEELHDDIRTLSYHRHTAPSSLFKRRLDKL